MTLSLSDDSIASLGTVIRDSDRLFGGMQITTSDLQSFIVDAYSLTGSRLAKEETLEFKVDKLDIDKMLGQGCFHAAFKGVDTKGGHWVMKKPLRMAEIGQIIPDFLKQVVAHELSAAFTKHCEKVLNANIFLIYNKPFLAKVSLKLKSGTVRPVENVFFELERFLDGAFEYFNRPNGELRISTGHLAPNRLPQIFSKWTYEATGGNVLVSDVQGCKLARGQYWCTDPIIFTRSGKFGHIDHGVRGITRFMGEVKAEIDTNSSLAILSTLMEKSYDKALDERSAVLIRLGDKALEDSMPAQVKRMLKDHTTSSEKGEQVQYIVIAVGVFVILAVPAYFILRPSDYKKN